MSQLITFTPEWEKSRRRQRCGAGMNEGNFHVVPEIKDILLRNNTAIDS